MELTEHTFPNLRAGIDRMVAPVVSVHMLISLKRHETCVMQDDPELPLWLAELT